MAKSKKPARQGRETISTKKKVFYPKYVDRLRKEALELTENYIKLGHGGDRTKSDPGLSHAGVLKVGRITKVAEYASKVAASSGLSDHEIGGRIEAWTAGHHRDIRWVNVGMPVYVLDADTAINFSLTDFGKMRTEDVVFPYDTFLLVLEEGTPLYMATPGGGATVPVKYIYVHRTVMASNGDHALWIQISGSNSKPLLGVFMKMHMPTVSSWLTTLGAASDEESKVLSLGPEATEAITKDENMAALDHALRIAIVFGMYATTPGMSGQAQPKRKNDLPALARRLDLPLPSDWVVTPISLMPEVRKIIRGQGIRGANLRLTARQIVRGHWKPSIRKFIKPYPRGHADRALAKVGRDDNPQSEKIEVRKMAKAYMTASRPIRSGTIDDILAGRSIGGDGNFGTWWEAKPPTVDAVLAVVDGKYFARVMAGSREINAWVGPFDSEEAAAYTARSLFGISAVKKRRSMSRRKSPKTSSRLVISKFLKGL